MMQIFSAEVETRILEGSNAVKQVVKWRSPLPRGCWRDERERSADTTVRFIILQLGSLIQGRYWLQ